MSHNILLLFLSDVKVTSDRKKLLPPVPYPGLGRTMTTNESAVRYLAQKNEVNADTFQIEKIFAFATDKVRNQYVGQNYAGDTVHAEDAVDQEGTPLTHLAYFKYRLQSERIIEDIEHCMPEDDEEKGIVGTVCPFDDTSNDVKENMKTIVGMANRIQTYIQMLPEDERNKVVLHADMTGGFRHASMMMLAVMRLMQYQGVEIGHVVYSNFNKSSGTGTVQEIGEIYHMFDLIAGAEEFATFGSVKTIQSYFANRPTTLALDNLIQAMGQFADAIKLSRRKDFETAIDNLNTSMQGFIEDGNSNELADALMGLMQKRFERDYSNVLQNTKDALAPIEWCLEHDYLQQALTLYTESIPEFLFSSGILCLGKETESCLENSKSEDEPRDPWFFLFADFKPIDKLLLTEEWKPNIEESMVEAVKRVVESIGKADMPAAKEAEAGLRQLMEQHQVAQKEIHCFAAVFKALAFLVQEPQKMLEPENLEPEIKTPLRKIFNHYKKEIEQAKFGTKKIHNILKGLTCIQTGNSLFKLFLYEYNKSEISKKYDRCKGLYNLFYLNLIQIDRNLDEEDIFKAMQTYFEIKDYRNDSNHAKMNPKHKQMDVVKLKTLMENGVLHLRLLEQKVTQ